MGNFIDTSKIDWASTDLPVFVKAWICYDGKYYSGIFEIDAEDVWFGMKQHANSGAINLNLFDTSMDSGDTMEYNIYLCTNRDEETGEWNMDNSIEITNQCEIRIEMFQGGSVTKMHCKPEKKEFHNHNTVMEFLEVFERNSHNIDGNTIEQVLEESCWAHHITEYSVSAHLDVALDKLESLISNDALNDNDRERLSDFVSWYVKNI